MATTIKSTALDFNNIKNNLKTFLAAKDQYKDYNFEASGLSNLLDVLAYNTHINALIANFSLNESFLSTAQLRSSIVSLAEGVGYAPDTTRASRAIVNLSFSYTAPGRKTRVTLPAYTKFSTTVDDVTYTFQTIEPFYATDDGTGSYEFVDENLSNNITLYEGTYKTKTFLVGDYVDNPVYIIPDTTLDSTTLTVKVYDSPSSNDFVTYENLVNAITISSQSRIFLLKEAPNGFYEMSFGDGDTFGIAPGAGSKIVVEYLSTQGIAANNASIFAHQGPFTDGNVTIAQLTTVTTGRSSGGASKESIESIRNNAPYLYASQNRMVTAEDYSALIKKKYGTYIDDIQAWGGEDNVDPEFGAVYVSIKFKEEVNSSVQSTVKLAIVELAEQLAIISFRLRFIDPIITYIETATEFDFNPRLTTLTQNTIQDGVEQTIEQFFIDNLGDFHKAFRRSQLLTNIDNYSQSILSSKIDIKMQQRFEPTTPTLTTTILELTNNSIPISELNAAISAVNQLNYNLAANIISRYATSSFTSIRTTISSQNLVNNATLYFPASIAAPDDENYIVTSSSFVYNNTLCVIRNKLSSNSLQIVSTATGRVVKDTIGSFDAAAGILRINYFQPTNITGGVPYIKVSAVPANQSAVVPVRNNILNHDPDRSTVIGRIVTATN